VVSSSSSFFSSPNLSGRRLDVYHTSTHCVALVRISDAGLKRAARVSLKIQDAKIRHLRTIAQFCWAISLQLKLWFHVKIKLFLKNFRVARNEKNLF